MHSLARSHTHVLVAVFPQQKVSNSAGDESVLTNELKFENILIYQDEFVSKAVYTGQLPVTAHTHSHTRKHTSITANTPAHTSSCINHPTFALCVQILALRRVCARALNLAVCSKTSHLLEICGNKKNESRFLFLLNRRRSHSDTRARACMSLFCSSL